MKAIVIHEFGSPDVLKYEDLPDPQLREREIRIRVHAATVNRVLDVSVRADREGARAPMLPLLPDVDCAGAIDAVGTGVRNWRSGMRVAAAGVMPLNIVAEDGDGYSGPMGIMGIKRPGGFAEFVCIPACGATELPGRLGFHHGGGDAPRPQCLEPAVLCRRPQSGSNDPGDEPAAISVRSAFRSPRT